MIIRITLIIMIITAFFLYLIILGASKFKTKQEIDLEDKEQMEYLKNYKSRWKNDRKN